MFSLLRGAK